MKEHKETSGMSSLKSQCAYKPPTRHLQHIHNTSTNQYKQTKNYSKNEKFSFGTILKWSQSANSQKPRVIRICKRSKSTNNWNLQTVGIHNLSEFSNGQNTQMVRILKRSESANCRNPQTVTENKSKILHWPWKIYRRCFKVDVTGEILLCEISWTNNANSFCFVIVKLKPVCWHPAFNPKRYLAKIASRYCSLRELGTE